MICKCFHDAFCSEVPSSSRQHADKLAANGGAGTVEHPCLLRGFSELYATLTPDGGHDISAPAVNMTGTGDLAGCQVMAYSCNPYG